MLRNCLFVFAISIPVFLKAQLSTVVQKGHFGAVKSVIFTPDGQYAITASRDKSAKLWELATGREIRTFMGHESTVNSLSVSRDGSILATGSADGSAIVWDIATGKNIFTTPKDSKYVTDVSLSQDAKLLITAGYGDMANIWNISTGQLIKTIAVNADQGSGYGVNIALSPDGQWLAFGEDNSEINIYSTDTWQKKKTLPRESGWCGGCGTMLAFSPDSKYVVKYSHGDTLKYYQVQSGKKVNTISTEPVSDLSSVRFSSDGKTLLVAAPSQFVVMEFPSGKIIQKQIFDKESEINEATYSADNKKIASAHNNNVAIIWDLTKKEPLSTLAGILQMSDKGGVNYNPDDYWQSHIAKYMLLKNNILLHPDGKQLLKGKFGTKARLWDIASGKIAQEYQGHEKAVICFDFSADGKWLVTGGADGKVLLWEVLTGRLLKTFAGHREPVFEVKFSHDGNMIASGSWDATVNIWEIRSEKKLTWFDFENSSAFSLSFSPNDLYIIVGKLGKELQMWEIDSKKLVRTYIGHTDIVSNICFSADNKWMLTSSWDGTAKVWDLANDLMVKKIKVSGLPLYAAIFSNQNKWIITAGGERVIKIWDAANGKLLKTLEGHMAEITSLQITRDDKMLISASLDGTIKYWDIESGKEFFEHINIGNNDWMVKTRSGYFNATQGARKAIHFVDGMKTFGADQFFEDFYRPDLLPALFKGTKNTGMMQGLQEKLSQSPPPLVYLRAGPADKEHHSDLYLRVVAQKGGGMDEIKLLHNGKVIPSDQLELLQRKGDSVEYKLTVPLVAGSNQFEASAFSRGRIESTTAKAHIASEQTAQPAVCHVMVIGINEYKNNSLNLNYARADAEAFVKAIQQNGEKIFSAVEVITLYDKDATRQNILSRMDGLAHKIHPKDVLVFYYAGHGSMSDNKFFMIPSDNTRLYETAILQKEAIDAATLQEKLKNIKALKQMIILDACQSGGSVELLAQRGAGEEKAMAQLSRSAGIHVFASAGSEQFATEFKELAHGLFTYVLLQGLMGEADGAPKDGKVTIYELKSYLDDQVPEYKRKLRGKAQYPFTFSIGHDFPVVLVGK